MRKTCKIKGCKSRIINKLGFCPKHSLEMDYNYGIVETKYVYLESNKTINGINFWGTLIMSELSFIRGNEIVGIILIVLSIVLLFYPKNESYPQAHN